ncbi:MAG: cytidine deaminase [Spirochaetales bacterium]|nr:cytidine deaminase [Spirochaetales bacterium]
MNVNFTPEGLMTKAREVAQGAYAPYSKFRVGAALAMGDGSIITGVNVENRSFGLSNCAERTAVFTALTQGHKDIRAVAIAGPDAWEPLSPCGACRQVLSEFCPADTPVYYDDAKGGFITSTIGELFPQDALHALSKRD